MIELTLARAKELLAEAVAEKGADYVYTGPDGEQGNPDRAAECYYVHGQQPGCIVGNVLHRAGVSLADLAQYEGQAAEDPVEQLTKANVAAVRLLISVQELQDRGTPWGEAVRQAEVLAKY
ncbi:hypothetical protein [Streptomyces misionensis]|uniref:hypothetical protein n=1 Tax=Streptomyces misionensis TaxID=67331 RepID=UPI003686FF7A